MFVHALDGTTPILRALGAPGYAENNNPGSDNWPIRAALDREIEVQVLAPELESWPRGWPGLAATDPFEVAVGVAQCALL